MRWQEISIPVIACGGVGNFSDFAKGIKIGGASAVAAANIFHYVEHSTIIAKANMKKDKINIRVDTAAKYKKRNFDKNGRLLMLNKQTLDNINWEIKEL